MQFNMLFYIYIMMETLHGLVRGWLLLFNIPKECTGANLNVEKSEEKNFSKSDNLFFIFRFI